MPFEKSIFGLEIHLRNDLNIISINSTYVCNGLALRRIVFNFIELLVLQIKMQ